jgi:hypothetical protein
MGIMKITESNIKDYIGKEIFCTAGLQKEKVLLRGYRGNKLAQISHPERFARGKYPYMTHDCLLCNLETIEN